MAVTPNSFLTLPLLYLQNLIAACPAFRTWTGTANEAAAKGRIHTLAMEVPESATLPYAVIGAVEGEHGNSVLSGETGLYEVQYVMLLTFFADIVADADVVTNADQVMFFWNTVSAVIAEAHGLQGTDGGAEGPRLTILSWNPDAPAIVSEDDEQDLTRFMRQDNTVTTPSGSVG